MGLNNKVNEPTNLLSLQEWYKPRQWLTEKEAAEYLNVSASFLAKNRIYSQGSDVIPFARLSRRCIRYDFRTLQSWLNEQIQAFKNEGMV